jgi:S1-C subfamily serine protease
VQKSIKSAPIVAVAIAATLGACGCGASSPGGTPKAANPPSAAQPRTFADLVASVRSGIIRIETTTCAGGEIGTGFLLSPRLVATVEHVVNGATAIDLKQGGKVVAHGTVIGSDPSRDVALIQSTRPLAGYRFTLASRPPRLGEDVAAMGFPLALPLTVTRGSVSGSDRTIPIDGIQRRSLVQTDAAVNPGNSGGPLISDSGSVVGLVDLGTTQANGLAFAVNAQVAGPLLAAWQAAPQAVAATTCQSAPAAQAAPSSSAGAGGTSTTAAQVASYAGQNFSISYPSDFSVIAAEVNKGTYLDTTIQGPSNFLVRVDENPTGGSGTVDAAAAPVLNGLRQSNGYTEISLQHTTFEGYAALRWEFEIPESGVLLHKVDLFFIDGSGQEWAILTQAPASVYNGVSNAFDALRNSFVDTSG